MQPSHHDEPHQGDLFDASDMPSIAAALPDGMTYAEAFLGLAEASELLLALADLRLQSAEYKGYVARRQVIGYGFEPGAEPTQPVRPLPAPLQALRDRVADWMGLPHQALVHTLVSRYDPGTPLGWHRDMPAFEEVAGVSLGGPAVMRLRPHRPHEPAARSAVLKLPLAPRSIYRLSGPARWAWQHSIAPTPGLRWSVTFRTAARTRRAP